MDTQPSFLASGWATVGDPCPGIWNILFDLCVLIHSFLTGADHYHVRVSQPQWLCGARLPLCTQAAHHPFPATEECGEPPGTYQPLWQCCPQGQRQPWSRLACYTPPPVPPLLPLSYMKSTPHAAENPYPGRGQRERRGRMFPSIALLLLLPLGVSPNLWLPFPRVWIPVCSHCLQRP